MRKDDSILLTRGSFLKRFRNQEIEFCKNYCQEKAFLVDSVLYICFHLHFSAACSSFVHQGDGLVDAILAEIQAGHVESGMGDVVAPVVGEPEEVQLGISRIPHVTSNINLTVDSMIGSEFRIPHIPVTGNLDIPMCIFSACTLKVSIYLLYNLRILECIGARVGYFCLF